MFVKLINLQKIKNFILYGVFQAGIYFLLDFNSNVFILHCIVLERIVEKKTVNFFLLKPMTVKIRLISGENNPLPEI